MCNIYCKNIQKTQRINELYNVYDVFFLLSMLLIVGVQHVCTNMGTRSTTSRGESEKCLSIYK